MFFGGPPVCVVLVFCKEIFLSVNKYEYFNYSTGIVSFDKAPLISDRRLKLLPCRLPFFSMSTTTVLYTLCKSPWALGWVDSDNTECDSEVSV